MVSIAGPSVFCGVMVYGADVANAVANALIAFCCTGKRFAGLSDVGAGKA